MEINDRFGNQVKPREWFLVRLLVIDEVVKRIKELHRLFGALAPKQGQQQAQHGLEAASPCLASRHPVSRNRSVRRSGCAICRWRSSQSGAFALLETFVACSPFRPNKRARAP
jgi:hypothetical protein